MAGSPSGLRYYDKRADSKWQPDSRQKKIMTLRGLLEKYPTFGREKETGLLGALDT